MATLTLKNVPDDLHRRLKSRAERNHRSLNREAIRCLEESVQDTPLHASDPALEQLDVLHRRLAGQGVWITAEQGLSAIEEGRE